MIRIECQHCGRPVLVDDLASGRKGRCPLCNAILSVPEESATLDQDSPAPVAAEVAGVVRAARAAANGAAPAHGVDPTPEEMHLESFENPSLAETHILPALQADRGNKGAWRLGQLRPLDYSKIFRARKGRNLRRIRLEVVLLAALIFLTVSGLLVFLFVCGRFGKI